MVGVAQLVEHQVVALVAAGSSPVAHPIRELTADSRQHAKEAGILASVNCCSLMVVS